MQHRPRLETISSPSNWPGSVGKFRPEQTRTRATWSQVPDREIIVAAMHQIHVIPSRVGGPKRGITTVTQINPMDPGTVADAGGELGPGWYLPPGGCGLDAGTFRTARP